MSLKNIIENLKSEALHHSETEIAGAPSAVGYEKKFKWGWMATQLNSFIVASDFGDQTITPEIIEKHLAESFQYAKKNYKGWPRGFQSGMGVISILMSSNVTEEAKEYCIKLKSGKKWAAFTIPVVMNTANEEVYYFKSKPMWGRIYYPHFQKLINNMTKKKG